MLVCISIQMMNFHYSYESCFCYPNQAALQAPSDDTTNAQTTEQETELQQNGRRKRKRGLPSRLKDVEDEVGGPVLAVFCMATYGEGDPTDNAQAFFDWLQEGSASVNGK